MSMRKILVSIPESLHNLLTERAKANFTSVSHEIRAAVMASANMQPAAQHTTSPSGSSARFSPSTGGTRPEWAMAEYDNLVASLRPVNYHDYAQAIAAWESPEGSALMTGDEAQHAFDRIKDLRKLGGNIPASQMPFPPEVTFVIGLRNFEASIKEHMSGNKWFAPKSYAESLTATGLSSHVESSNLLKHSLEELRRMAAPYRRRDEPLPPALKQALDAKELWALQDAESND